LRQELNAVAAGVADKRSTNQIRCLPISEVNKPSLQKVIQHTAPISPGNSGGPLFNEQGYVVGINTFLAEGGQNLNFAIPIDYVKSELGKTDDKPLLVSGGVRIRQKDGDRI